MHPGQSSTVRKGSVDKHPGLLLWEGHLGGAFCESLLVPQRDGAPFVYRRAQLKNCWGVFSCPILFSLLPLENSFQISNLYPTLASGSAFRAPNIGHPWNQGLCNSRAHQAFPTAEVPGTMY